MFNTFSSENIMINQNIVRFTRSVALRASSVITLDTGDNPVSAREAAEVQRDLDEIMKFVRLAVKERPGSEYREALEDRAWQCWQHCYKWGSFTFE
jgi:hypothetical protein